jgi:hypothetical protein
MAIGVFTMPISPFMNAIPVFTMPRSVCSRCADPRVHDRAKRALLVRSHWGVENQNHHTFDTAFVEDDRPWIEADENGMLAVLLLRRIAYTLLALYRSVTLRSDEGRATRWKALLQSVRDVLIAATEEQLAGLRLRETAAATR